MQVYQFFQIGFFRAFTYSLIIAQLGACGGGGGSSSAENSLVSLTSLPNIVPAGSATLNWTAPVARSDQSPLSLADIGGYRVYYGTVEGEYTYQVDVKDGTAVEAVIDDLSTGTYYFVVTTYDTEGRESEYSELVVKTI
jgi:hypothetical protein